MFCWALTPDTTISASNITKITVRLTDYSFLPVAKRLGNQTLDEQREDEATQAQPQPPPDQEKVQPVHTNPCAPVSIFCHRPPPAAYLLAVVYTF